MTVVVGPLLATDHARWADMWRSYLDFYNTSVPPEVYDHTWARIMKGTELQALAARSEGAMVGITHFLFHSSAWTMTPVCYLQDLYVQPATRGLGAGRALIEAVAHTARSHDATRMYWLTQDHNAPARLLYDRLAKHTGFIRYEYPLAG